MNLPFWTAEAADACLEGVAVALRVMQ